MKIHDEMIQGSHDWDDIRSIRPTASEFGKIYTGGGKVSTQREAYMRKLSIARRYPVPQFTGNEWTERGHNLEPEARERFIQETGYDVREVGFIEHDGGVAGGSPDALIFNAEGEPVAGLEIKCFKLDKHLGIVNKAELPTANKAQVHGSMWVTGLKAWVFVVYCPEAFPLDFQMIEVTPDDYTSDLGEQVELFCEEYKNNWQQYLAEYEVDLLNKDVATSLPIVSSLLADREELVI